MKTTPHRTTDVEQEAASIPRPSSAAGVHAATPQEAVENWRALHRGGYFRTHRCYQDRTHDDGVANLRRLLKPGKDDVLLEIGCGYGRVLHHLLPDVRRAIGMDIAAEPLDEARELLRGCGDVELLLTDGLSLHPVADASVDAAFAFTVFQHLTRAQVAAYLCEAMRVLRPGGRFCAQFLTGRDPGADVLDTAQEQSLGYTAAQICSLAEDAGLAVQTLERHLIENHKDLAWFWLLAMRPADPQVKPA
ncbi:MAG: class I SAM-dependent methyltransferase [Phycisphaerales bacterium]|nr:class I SAM-dependent methyltransferase [Phycisphaerales bacterium]